MIQIFKPLASLRLTLILLAFSLMLVFFGTMAQEPLGLYMAQARFFQSAFVDAASLGAAIRKTLQMLHIYLTPATAADVLAAPYIPVFPGGYLLGSLLVINLIAAHVARFKFGWKKSGIVLVHTGLIVLLIGQLCTDIVADESSMRLIEGQTLNYSERDRQSELAVVETTGDRSRIVAFPDSLLSTGTVLSRPELPFTVKVTRYYGNSMLTNRSDKIDAPTVTDGPGKVYAPLALPPVTSMNEKDAPSAIVEVVGPEGSIGSYLVSLYLGRPQPVTYKDRRFELSIRPRRIYKDFSLTLLDFRHDKYPGTETAKNFSSKVRLENPGTGEKREVLIYMNNPLRYQGMTFYQASFDPRDERVTVLQVVRNPAWLTPYFACILVGVGLAVQFGIHLVGFVRKKASGDLTAKAAA